MIVVLVGYDSLPSDLLLHLSHLSLMLTLSYKKFRSSSLKIKHFNFWKTLSFLEFITIGTDFSKVYACKRLPENVSQI